MKEKFFLIFLGTFFGLASGGGLYLVYKNYLVRTQEATHFESLEDFQRAMLQRDDRDVKADRSVSLRSIIQPHPSDLIMFDLRPNLNVKFQGVPVRTNSCGMRGDERPVVKPNGVFRIALLGDSFAFGWGVRNEMSFAVVMEDLLNQFLDGKGRVEVLNLGVPGYSTFQQVALFEERALEFSPDAVLVYFIENDFGLPFYIRDIHRKGRMISGTKFAKKSWSGKDPEITKQNKQILKVLDANRALMRLSRIAAQEGIPVYTAINPNRQWARVKEKLWALRKRDAVIPVWIREEFLEIIERREIDIDSLSLPTDPHPSAVKHAILGELLASAMMHEVSEFFAKEIVSQGDTTTRAAVDTSDFPLG